MSLLKRVGYIGIGVLLALLVILGAAATFAQNDDGAETPAAPAEETDGGATLPQWGSHGFHDFGARPEALVNQDELLAEALGISVEDLQAAQEDARVAAIEQAVADGLITEAQAEQLQDAPAGRHGRLGRGFFGADHEEFLADALDISVEELQAAQAEVQAARLDAMVEAGVITQEQADLMAAREAVQGFVDRDGIATMMQDAYESAVQAALDGGAITQGQADLLLENAPTFDGGFFGPGGHGGPGGPGRPGGHPHGGPGGGPGGFFPGGGTAPALTAPAGA